jgi:hypothetical protein
MRRAQYGLANPLVTHRFALWGLAVAIGAANLSASYVGLVLRRVPTGAIELAIGVGGVCVAVCLTLAFLPPRAYRLYIARRAERVRG